jgi:hypothetical protein
MTRPRIAVTVQDEATGETVHSETRAAFNAGIRASEAAVRLLARAAGGVYEGSRPTRDGGVYVRIWSSPGRPSLRATVRT